MQGSLFFYFEGDVGSEGKEDLLMRFATGHVNRWRFICHHDPSKMAIEI